MTEFEDDNDIDNEEWSDEWEYGKSKSQVKRDLNELKSLGKQLIDLPLRDLNKLVLPESLLEAVVDAQSMSKGALKRQVGFIGGIIANEDYEKIARDLALLKQPHQGQVKQFHQLEMWRDKLLADDETIYGQLISTFPGFDVQHVRQLVRNAQREQKLSKPPKSARLVFQYLQSLQKVNAEVTQS